MIRHIKNVLQEITTPESNKHSWKQFLLGNWKSIIGDLYNHVSLQKVYDDAVVLGVYDSCWLQELYLLTPLLLSKINQTLDAPHVKRIHFKQIIKKQTISLLAKQEEQIIESKKMPISDKEQKALEKITDESLRSVLDAFRIHCKKGPEN